MNQIVFRLLLVASFGISAAQASTAYQAKCWILNSHYQHSHSSFVVEGFNTVSSRNPRKFLANNSHSRISNLENLSFPKIAGLDVEHPRKQDQILGTVRNDPAANNAAAYSTSFIWTGIKATFGQLEIESTFNADQEIPAPTENEAKTAHDKRLLQDKIVGAITVWKDSSLNSVASRLLIQCESMLKSNQVDPYDLKDE